MKYKTFRNLFVIGLVAAVVGGIWHCSSGSSDKPVPTHASATYRSAPSTPQAEPAPYVASPVRPVALETSLVKNMVEQWLTTHGNRSGKMRRDNFLPDAPFRATAIRFPSGSAEQFSNDPQQWSQIKIDLNRDGVDDEKWLLKNGRTYKREVLAGDGRTVVSTQYFNN